jgi:uncharacterized MAPEG superfamily protein
MNNHIAIATSLNIETMSIIVSALLVWFSALIQNFSNAFRHGPEYVMSDRARAAPTDGFFGRATRTLSNNMESALMYVPPMIIVIVNGMQSNVSAVTAATYIGARWVFVVSYWLNIPVLRSAAWFVGMACCAIIATVAVVGLVSP